MEGDYQEIHQLSSLKVLAGTLWRASLSRDLALESLFPEHDPPKSLSAKGGWHGASFGPLIILLPLDRFGPSAWWGILDDKSRMSF